MKITTLNLFTDNDGSPRAFIDLQLGGTMLEAMSRVQALFATTGLTAPTYVSTPASPIVLEPKIDPVALDHEAKLAEIEAAFKTPAPARTRAPRGPRTNPDAQPVLEIVPPEAVTPPAEAAPAERRRRPVIAEPAAPEVKTITDADLIKACSNAAAIIGPNVVMAVVKDFSVESVDKLAADVRERFLKELAEEVELGQLAAAEQAKA